MVLNVVGSSPISHPKRKRNFSNDFPFFCYISVFFRGLFSPILLRRCPCLFPEKRTEVGSIRKVEVIRYFLYALLRVLKQRNALTDNGFEHQLLHRISTNRLGQYREILRRQTKFICIKLHATLLHVMHFNQLNQPYENIVLMSYRGSLSDKFTIINGAKPIRQSQQ